MSHKRWACPLKPCYVMYPSNSTTTCLLKHGSDFSLEPILTEEASLENMRAPDALENATRGGYNHQWSTNSFGISNDYNDHNAFDESICEFAPPPCLILPIHFETPLRLSPAEFSTPFDFAMPPLLSPPFKFPPTLACTIEQCAKPQVTRSDNNDFMITWPTQSKFFDTLNRQVVSPSFDVGRCTFKFVVVPAIKNKKRNHFKASKGKGHPMLKLIRGASNMETRFKIWVGGKNEEETHDFVENDFDIHTISPPSRTFKFQGADIGVCLFCRISNSHF